MSSQAQVDLLSIACSIDSSFESSPQPNSRYGRFNLSTGTMDPTPEIPSTNYQSDPTSNSAERQTDQISAVKTASHLAIGTPPTATTTQVDSYFSLILQ